MKWFMCFKPRKTTVPAIRDGSSKPARHGASVPLLGYLLGALLALGAAELGSMFVADAIQARRPQLLYSSPVISRTDFDRYLTKRDSTLGWTATPDTALDASGSRRNPTFPEPARDCVSLFGDSFTFGEEVDDRQAWSNLLSIKLGCRVGNYGVGGFGTDQAFLRYETQPTTGQIAILGIYPHDVLRNLSQYLYFLGMDVFSLTPRFRLQDDGTLSLVSLPDWSYEEFIEALRDLPHAFPDETFLPGSEYGPSIRGFPHTWSMLHLLGSEQVLNGLKGRASWASVLTPGHPSRGLAVTETIVREFARLAKSRGQRSLVLVFPTGSSFRQFKRTGTAPTQPLTDSFRAAGVDHVDLHASFASYLGARLLWAPDGAAGLRRALQCQGQHGHRSVRVRSHSADGHIPGTDDACVRRGFGSCRATRLG